MSDLKPLYIIGAGGFGREVAWLVERINETKPTWDVKGFIDDDRTLWKTVKDGYMIKGGKDYLEKIEKPFWVVLALGNAESRERYINRFVHFSYINFATLVDPSVVISERVSIGEGSIICAGNIITVDVTIGRHCIINLDCTIGHDAVLGDFTTLYPSVNISGAVTIGNTTEIGTGAHVIQGVDIGTRTIIGAGTVVVKSIESDVTAVGNPARIIKRHNSAENFSDGA